ncbi:MAG: hypothetical protein CL912_00405 [Deltaproteobacteria bacterium]|nr:hypothetical protein [Deltaproteobacteria bacterium]
MHFVSAFWEHPGQGKPLLCLRIFDIIRVLTRYRSNSFITPAKSHPGVIIAAVASRDLSRGKAYAKKFSIPNVHGSYQGQFNISKQTLFGPGNRSNQIAKALM